MSFDHLGLTPELIRAVSDQGYLEPTPVQSAAIPLVLAGRDLLAGAQTGTGKTAAFVLPMLQHLNAEAGRADDRRAAPRRQVRALVVVPTRELALQVEESVRTYGARRPIRSVAIYGGVGFGSQATALRAGAQIVVATPGRLLDHVGQRTIDLSAVEILVLDEADRMLDMGFIHDIRRILALLPRRRQSLLFSATFSDTIRELANGFLERPAEVDVAPRNTPAELVRQLVLPVDRERKRELLSSLVRSGRIEQALVFTRTKHGANRLAEQLGRDGIATAAIHGNKAQAQRVRALADFKAGRVAVLVATDIAARGLDIDALPHVVNYEMPMVPEDYVHRIGRTGRAGVTGRSDLARLCRRSAPPASDRTPPPAGHPGRGRGWASSRTARSAPEPIRLRSTEHRALASRPGRPRRARASHGRAARPPGVQPATVSRQPAAVPRQPAGAATPLRVAPQRPAAQRRPAAPRPRASAGQRRPGTRAPSVPGSPRRPPRPPAARPRSPAAPTALAASCRSASPHCRANGLPVSLQRWSGRGHAPERDARPGMGGAGNLPVIRGGGRSFDRPGASRGRPDRALVAVIPEDAIAGPVRRLDDLQDCALAGGLPHLLRFNDDAIARHGLSSVHLQVVGPSSAVSSPDGARGRGRRHESGRSSPQRDDRRAFPGISALSPSRASR